MYAKKKRLIIDQECKQYLEQDIEAGQIEQRKVILEEMNAASHLVTYQNFVSDIVWSERRLLESEEEKSSKNYSEDKILQVEPQQKELQHRRPYSA